MKSNKITKGLGDVIKATRRAQNMTGHELAKALKVSRRTVIYAEQGVASTHIYMKLISYLGIKKIVITFSEDYEETVK